MGFNREQDELATAIRELCGPTLQIDPVAEDIYAGAVLIRVGYHKPTVRKIEDAGYRVSPCGRHTCVVEPPREKET